MSKTEPRISAATLQEYTTTRVPLAGRMGMRVVGVETGVCTVDLAYQSEFVRPGGTVAGPVMMALADFAMWGAVLTLIGPIELAVTTNLNINFLNKPRPGPLTAVARVFKEGKRLMVGEVNIFSGDDELLVAHATLTYSVPPVTAQ